MDRTGVQTRKPGEETDSIQSISIPHRPIPGLSRNQPGDPWNCDQGASNLNQIANAMIDPPEIAHVNALTDPEADPATDEPSLLKILDQRQDEVLSQLETLNQRVMATLKQWTTRTDDPDSPSDVTLPTNAVVPSNGIGSDEDAA